MTDDSLLESLTEIAAAASAAILALRASCGAATKRDGSPVTAADRASEAVILERIARVLPGVPVISEEQVEAGQAPPPASFFALVDPLDGTREFIAGNGEFTINIALVKDGVPVLGIVAAPALGVLWRGARGRGAERLQMGVGEASAQPIEGRKWRDRPGLALVSRSHIDPASLGLIERLGVAREPCGSALKFCRLAEGGADLYPRLAPTMEWDIAAGHAVLAAAGGTVLDPHGGNLSYGMASEGFRVPGFVAASDPAGLQRMLGEAR